MAIIAEYRLDELESKIQPPPFERGRNAYGYGRKITTQHMVKLPDSNRWRRVYCCCFSNAGTCYVSQGDDWIVIY